MVAVTGTELVLTGFITQEKLKCRIPGKSL